MKLKIQILIFFLSTTISLSKNLKTKKNLETPQQILEKLKENNKQLRKAKITVNNLLNNKKLPAQEIIKHISQEIGTEYEKEKNKMKLKVKEILNGTYHEPSQNETIEDISNDIVDLIINEQSEKNNENDIFENENSDDEKNVKEEKEEEKNENKKNNGFKKCEIKIELFEFTNGGYEVHFNKGIGNFTDYYSYFMDIKKYIKEIL